MRRLTLLLLAAALVAIAALRRRVPTYPDWDAWTTEREGEALPPRDPYVEGQG